MTDWPVKTLDALCEEGVVLLGRGNIISKKDIAANPGPFPIYSSARENDGKFGEYGDFMFDEEMITWSIDGGGRLFYRPKHKFSVTNVGGTLRVLNPKVLEIRYLHRALENLHSRKVFDWVFKAHPSVIRKVYDEIPVPPLEEQKRIVELLDAATARVTELTACYEQARANANNLFTSASREAFESNPDWPVKTIGDVCAVLDSLRKPITKRDRTSGAYPYYGATGIVDYVGDYIFDERLVLVGEDGAKWSAGERTAFIAEGKYWVNNHAHVLRCKPGVLVDSWLTHYLTMSDLNRYVSGLTVPKLNQGSLVSIEIPLPPLEEQERIVGHLDLMKAKTSEMVSAYDAKLTAAKNLRQSILEAAFAGDL
jgi:type I restriction enzyme, S subunit